MRTAIDVGIYLAVCPRSKYREVPNPFSYTLFSLELCERTEKEGVGHENLALLRIKMNGGGFGNIFDNKAKRLQLYCIQYHPEPL